MKTITTYFKGVLIGMIAEYAFRLEFGYLQVFILSMLIIGMTIDVVDNCDSR